jgi:hypothetical protein
VAPYRQWTLSFPVQLRFMLARDSALLSQVLGYSSAPLFAFQRRTARRLGVESPSTLAVTFVQRFGSALQLTPHFHVLVPEDVFEEESGPGSPGRLCPLPPPADEEVEAWQRAPARRTITTAGKVELATIAI